MVGDYVIRANPPPHDNQIGVRVRMTRLIFQRQRKFKMSILSLPSEILVEIATHLGTIRNLANFKMTCTGIYSAIESDKVDRKRLPHEKIKGVIFSESRPDDGNPSATSIRYQNPNRIRYWDYSDPLATKLSLLLSQYLILEDDCEVQFWMSCVVPIPLLKSLSEINYGNAIKCDFFGGPSNPAEYQEALPFIQKFLEKVSCFSDMLFLLHEC